MKKFQMIGITVAFALLVSMPVFAANTRYCDNVDYRGAACYYVDEDGDGICDNLGRYYDNGDNSAVVGRCGNNRGGCRR